MDDQDVDVLFQVVRAFLRRVSLGKALETVHPDDVSELLPNNRSNNNDEELGSSNVLEHQGNKLNDVDFHEVSPRSLFNHTLRSNVDGFVTAAPSLVLIVAVDFLVNALHSLGGVFNYMHAVRCSFCVLGIELIFMLTAH